MTNAEKTKVLIDQNSLETNSEEEEDENRDEHQKPLIDCDSNGVENVIPLSIGKIKIFKPRRRNRVVVKRYVTLCTAIFALIFLLVYVIKMQYSLSQSTNSYKNSKTSCDRLETTLVWNKTFPMLTIESALRLVDINNDTILDVIVPFGTGCGGGVMAVDGRNGEQLWVRYTPHELFASNCNNDLNEDGIKDCILAGRMASLYAIDSLTGEIIWYINSDSGDPIIKTSNFYTPLYIPRDIDRDGVPEIVVMHGGDPLRKPNERIRIPGRLIVMSAKKGNILSWSVVPDKAESYYSPQLLVHPDGTLLVLFGTGGETHAGSLFVVTFDDLFNQRMSKSVYIYTDCCKGVMTPPVLIDLDSDGIPDIVMSLFNSTVIAFNGLTFKKMWKTDFPGSETYSTPAVGYFNNDSIPDFAVLYQFGPGFPIYYHQQLSILDGKNGHQLLKSPVDMLIGTQSSPLTISTLSTNDLFLYWYSSCQNITSNLNSAQAFKISPGTTIHDNSRADFCKLRFNSTIFTQFRAISPTSTSIIYDSREHNNSYINYTAIGYEWLHRNMDSIDYENKIQESDIDQPVYEPTFQENQYKQPMYAEYQYKRREPYSDNSYDQSYDSQPFSYDQRFKTRRRNKRHVGVHDGGGVQRVISTGTLAPPLRHKLNTIDVIFATFWFPPSQNVHLMSPEMEKCISKYMDPKEESRLRLEESESPYKKLHYDHDAYEEEVKHICSQQTKQIQSENNVRIVKDMGAMTLFRTNLKCSSNKKDSNIALGEIKEYMYQLWSSYMGKDADCVVNDY